MKVYFKRLVQLTKKIFYYVEQTILTIAALIEFLVALVVFLWPYIKWLFIIGIIIVITYTSFTLLLFFGVILLFSQVKVK